MEEGKWDLSTVDYEELKKSQTTLVFGQMNEPPGARASVALTGLAVAESFRDSGGKGGDTLLFIDNIFRFVQAGSEVSALLGRMPSAVGYQPTLASEMGTLQERIASTTYGSITSVQAVYVPADDLTDPAPATTFSYLDASTVLSRKIAPGIYRGSTDRRRASSIRMLGQEHYDTATRNRFTALQRVTRYFHPRHGGAVGRGSAYRKPRPKGTTFPFPTFPYGGTVHRAPSDGRH